MTKWKYNNQKKIGEISKNRFGTKMEIVSCNGNNDIVVRFLDGNDAKVHTIYQNFRNGSVKNPYDRTICGRGFFGEGKYLSVSEERAESGRKKTSLEYHAWTDMFIRCYEKKQSSKHHAYFGICSVNEEWHNFQNFAEWFNNNKYPVNERLHLDKDILVKDNKIYSPNTCLLVPQRINMIFMTMKKTNNSDLPTGIRRSSYQDVNVRYGATYNGKQIGTFDTLEEATEKYMIKKRENIKTVANEYKNIIPQKVYDALIEW